MSDSEGSILATLFAGSSPGFGKVHARLLGEEDVFSVKLSNYEIASGVDDWLDKRLLAVDRDPVKISIKRPSAPADSLERGDEFLWTWNGNKTDPEKVTDYIARFQNLRVLGIAEPQSGSFTNETSIELELPQETITLDFFETGEDEFVVTSTKIAGTYRVASYSVDRLLIEEADVILFVIDGQCWETCERVAVFYHAGGVSPFGRQARGLRGGRRGSGVAWCVRGGHAAG